MYNVYNKSNVYFLWNIPEQKQYLIGDRNDLIFLIVKNYRYVLNPLTLEYEWDNSFLKSFARSTNEFDKRYQLFDGYDRCLDIKEFEEEAYRLFLSNYKDKSRKFYWYKSKNYKYVYRFDPIEGTGKVKGGPPIRLRRIAPLKKMYANPEYKGFNRGSPKELPCGWWDDWYRCKTRSWKQYRKHQWKQVTE